MIQAVWIATLALGCIAAIEPRSRPMLALMALVAIQTALADKMEMGRLMQILMRAPIDMIAGLFAVLIASRERWSLAVPVLFGVSLIAHGAFWFARHMGVDLWLWYAHALNLLFLAQMMAVAYPGGERLAGELASMGRMGLSKWRGRHSDASEKEGRSRAQRDRAAYDRPDRVLFVPLDSRT